MARPARTRAEQREATAAKIVAAARALFAQRGYERATIRAIATRAKVDPSLVMQHFGSKDALFAHVAAGRWDVARWARGSPSELAHALVASFLTVTGETTEQQAVMAMLRSSLTTPEAARATRRVLFEEGAARLLDARKPDAGARGQLAAAALLGVFLARHLLKVRPLSDLPAARLSELLEPAILSLLTADDVGPGSGLKR